MDSGGLHTVAGQRRNRTDFPWAALDDDALRKIGAAIWQRCYCITLAAPVCCADA
jgi:hypothetical protein